MKNRKKLLVMYKDYYKYTRVLDDDDNVVVVNDVPVCLPSSKVNYSGGIINAIKSLIAQDDPLYTIFGLHNNDMTFEYYFNWSGQKWIAPVYEELLEVYDNDLEKVDNQLAKIILNRYKHNWTERYLTYHLDYNPIHNYDMTEMKKSNVNVVESVSSDDSVYGYNSNQPSPTNSSSSERTTLGDEDDNYVRTNRSGNIGVTTSQKMLMDELEVRRYDFIKSIYVDLDTVLVLSIY